MRDTANERAEGAKGSGGQGAHAAPSGVRHAPVRRVVGLGKGRELARAAASLLHG